MSSKVKEALNSVDPRIILKARGTEKGRVTRNVDRILAILKIDETKSDYNHESISKIELKETEVSLREAFKNVQELHDRYQWHRVDGATDVEEAKIEEEQNAYIVQIEDKFHTGLKALEKYNLACEISQKESPIKTAKESFENAKKIAEITLNSDDNIVQKTATIVKENLVECFDSLLKINDDYMQSLKKKSINVTENEKIDLSKEKMAYWEVTNRLDVMIKRNEEKENTSEKSALIGQDLNTSIRESRSEGEKFLKLQKLTPPKFSGLYRDFPKFKRDFNTIVAVEGRSAIEIGATLKESIPKKHQHLIDNLSMDKHLEMMQILTRKFGGSRLIVAEVVSEIRNMKPVTTDKMFIEFVDSIDKIHRDLVELNLESEIATTNMVTEIERKLPNLVRRDWSYEFMEEEEEKTPKEMFDAFMKFLQKTQRKVEFHSLDTKQSGAQGRSFTNNSYVSGQSIDRGNSNAVRANSGESNKKKEERSLFPCLVCNADGVTDLRSTQHPMDSCDVWNGLSVREKEKKVKCKKHPFATNHTTDSCTKSVAKCRLCSETSHHFLLCPKRKTSTKSANTKMMSGDSDLLPVMVQTAYVQTPGGFRLGAMFDLCSTDHYITHKKAKRLGCTGVEVELIVEGIKGMEYREHTMLYNVSLIDKNGVVNQYQCYGLDKISSTAPPPDKKSYSKLCKMFGIGPDEVKKPEEIDILISMRNSSHHPSPIKILGDMTLYEGVYGKVFGGSDPNLKFTPHQKSYPALMIEVDRRMTHTMRTAVKSATLVSSAKMEREFLDYFKHDNIGVECNPRCGGCKCGQCPIGSKPMSLKDEREYERFQSNLKYEEDGSMDDPGPYWRTSYPWNIDRHQLTNNKSAVLGVMNSTKRKLSKDPYWEQVYEEQLRDLIDKGFAREVSDDELIDWIKEGGKTYFIAHQVALNPGSKSTPVRIVFNSSQVFKGHSLNNSWDLGPDIMSNLHGVLLRFRKDVVGGQGDISKMFYMVRVTKEEEMMQLFVWQFKDDRKLRTFAMTRLVMGNKPSSNISIVALKETAKLNDFENKYPVAYQALMFDSYVDNVFLTAPNINTLVQGIEEIETVSTKGGFKFKEWIISGQNLPEQKVSLKLPNSIDPDEEKALGVFWNVKEDQFYVKPGLTDKEKRLIDQESIDRSNILSPSVKPVLTLRICLSFHAKTYDPLGLVLPTRMIGNILFRSTLQILKKEQKGKIPWDERLPDDLVIEWMDYFNMLAQIHTINFRRSIKPDNVDENIDPVLVTFSDGNPDSYGTVAYTLWSLKDGSKVATLVMSKAKLGPLLMKGETVRNELSGATIASRLKDFIYENSGLSFRDHIPFLDSQIVQAMIKKESYGFNSFAGLRVGEIQMKTDRNAWRHIPSKENISDILTKGASPDVLGPNSVWQAGPVWLTGDRSLWPITEANSEITDNDDFKKFILKTKSNKTSQSFHSSSKIVRNNNVFSNDWYNDLVARCSSLNKLIRCVAYVVRAATFLSSEPSDQNMEAASVGGMPHKFRNNLVKLKTGSIECTRSKEISATEFQDAWKIIVHIEQTERLSEKDVLRLVPRKTDVKIATNGSILQHIILGGRVPNFPEGFSSNTDIPILPYGPLSKLVISHYHNKFHKDVDTIVAHVRRDVWVVKARKIASSIDLKCRLCLEKRKRIDGQIMGELPTFRSEIMPAWSAVNMDLFGPIIIRDDCVKKGPRIHKKVYGVVFVCTLTRGVYIDIATDYSTESVLHTVRRLMALKGNVKLIISDPGSQLRGAAKELIDWRKGWSKDLLIRFGAEKGIDWSFIMPNSQHQNGAAEIIIKMVKGVKKAFMHALGDTKLSLNELNTMMAEISNLVNERPIGVKPNSRTDPEFLSPNSLFLGRCSDRISSGPFVADEIFIDDPVKVNSRFLLVQAVTNQFWKVWIKLYFPSLIVRQKWHTEKRNMKVNDVCLLKDEDAFRAEWRLARVTATFPDRFNKVRNVEVKVVPAQDGSKDYRSVKPNHLKRHVSNLIVLVPVEEQNNDDAPKEDDDQVDQSILLEDDAQEETEIRSIDIDERKV